MLTLIKKTLNELTRLKLVLTNLGLYGKSPADGGIDQFNRSRVSRNEADGHKLLWGAKVA